MFQPSTSGTGAAEIDTNKSNLSAPGPLSTTEHHSKPKNKYEILLQSYQIDDQKLSSILKHCQNVGNNSKVFEGDELQFDLESLLVDAHLRKSAVQNQLQTFNNLPCKLTADNHFVHSKPIVETSPKNNASFVIDYIEEPPFKESAFWSSIKPYTDDINTEDIKWLTDKIESYSDEKSYEIPSLGTHYTKKLSAKNNHLNKQIPHYVKKSVIKASNLINSCNKLTTAYEPVMLSLTENLQDLLEDSDSDTKFHSKKNIETQLKNLEMLNNNTNSSSCSTSQGNLSESDDEVLAEIIKCNNALKKLEKSNQKNFTYTLDKCFEDYQKKFIKNKLNVLNHKIVHFKRQTNESWTGKQKKDQISKEDNEIKCLLQERNFYLSQLNSFVTVDIGLEHLEDIKSNDEKTKSMKKFNNKIDERNRGETKPCVNIDLRDHENTKTTERGEYTSVKKSITERSCERPIKLNKYLGTTQQSRDKKAPETTDNEKFSFKQVNESSSDVMGAYKKVQNESRANIKRHKKGIICGKRFNKVKYNWKRTFDRIKSKNKNGQNELQTNVNVNNVMMIKNKTVLIEGANRVMAESITKQSELSPTLKIASEDNLKLADETTKETVIESTNANKCKERNSLNGSSNLQEINETCIVVKSTLPCSTPVCDEFFTDYISKDFFFNRSRSKTHDTEHAHK